MITSSIEYNDKEYPTRTITIFKGTDEEVTIDVSTEELSAELEKNDFKDTEVDDSFACYVPVDVLMTMSDKKFAKYIEKNYYM